MNRTLRTLLSGATALLSLTQIPCFGAARSAAMPVLATCNWTHPGVNPFMGDLAAAVDRYQDISAPTRARLKARMAQREYDEIVDIRRDGIKGRNEYADEITDMHFGTGQLCHKVNRAGWSPRMLERGLVYCEEGHCILVPTVCRNVSRIQRRTAQGGTVQGTALPAAAEYAAAAGDEQPLDLAGPIGWAPGMGVAGAPSGVAAGGGSGIGQHAYSAAGGAAGVGAPGLAWGSQPSELQTPLASINPQTGHATVSNTESRADALPVTAAVPEPETWCLMAAGLLAVGWRLLANRRQRSAAA